LILLINFNILVSINFSNHFENAGSREIGLKSPRTFGDETFSNGIAHAFSKIIWKRFYSCIHLLNNFVSMGVKILLASFTNLGGIYLVQVAEYVFIWFMQVLTSSLNSRKTKERMQRLL